MLNDTIVAISTALSQGAISIIRLSGSDSINIANKIFDRDLLNVKSHTITYGNIIENKKIIDEVLISVFKAPKSFTCEDIVEINCHGGSFISYKILNMCLVNGARLARNGEFSQRAYLNGRIDLSQAEAIQDIIESNNENQANKAISSLKGSVSKLINPLIDKLVQMIANIEVNIDYPEYDDVEVITKTTLLPLAQNWLDDIDEIIEKAKISMFIKDGINTVILGKPNVGKSSLLNSLLNEDKAIVTNIAGTTRDLVEGKLRLKNITLNLIDTAGIRDTDDKVEQIGINKSKEAILKADLIIIVLDINNVDDQDYQLLEELKDRKPIVVYNKDDDQTYLGLSISALNNNVDKLIKEIEDRYKYELSYVDKDSLNNQRQLSHAIKAKESMVNVINSLKQDVELDLVSIDLYNAYDNLKSILGESNKEDLLDEIFKRFCLGK